jgi:hypothetical protein
VSQKPQHSGINEATCATEINWALKSFVEMVRDGDEVPHHLLEFIAGGVEKYLKGGKPWSSKVDSEFKNSNAIGLMLAIIERGGSQLDIASHWGVTDPRISQMIALPEDDPRGLDLMRRNILKNSYLALYKNKNLSDMLNALSEMRESLKK